MTLDGINLQTLVSIGAHIIQLTNLQLLLLFPWCEALWDSELQAQYSEWLEMYLMNGGYMVQAQLLHTELEEKGLHDALDGEYQSVYRRHARALLADPSCKCLSLYCTVHTLIVHRRGFPERHSEKAA